MDKILGPKGVRYRGVPLYVHTYTHIQTYTHTCTCTHAYRRAHTYRHTHAHRDTHTCTCTPNQNWWLLKFPIKY